MALVKYNNNSISAVSSLASLPSGTLVPIKTLTASSSATVDFINGSSDVVLDSTYPIYKFVYINLHPATDNVRLGINFTTDGTNFNVTKTTTFFNSAHFESDAGTELGYQTSQDLAQGTGTASFSAAVGNGNDESVSGDLYLFSPSSTTFIKHFMSRNNGYESRNISQDHFTAGYCNTTSAITGVRFQAFSGNLDSGTIKLYGIKDS
jgi:hypothetical protein